LAGTVRGNLFSGGTGELASAAVSSCVESNLFRRFLAFAVEMADSLEGVSCKGFILPGDTGEIGEASRSQDIQCGDERKQGSAILKDCLMTFP
jgi:hypothetical protein